MPGYRALVLDLDGTLLDRRQQLPPAHRDLLALAAAAHLTVCIATARYHGSAAMVLGDHAHLADRGVFAGGPIAHCCHTDWTWQRSIPAATVDRLCAAIRHLRPHHRIGLATADGHLAYDPDPGLAQRTEWGVGGMTPLPLAQARHRDALRLTVWSETPDHTLTDTAQELARIDANLRVIPADRGQAIYITATGADKGAGTIALLTHLGIDPVEAIACGDDLTDLSLIRAVGHGIAMADGHPNLLAATPHHAAPAAEGGLLAAITTLLERQERAT